MDQGRYGAPSWAQAHGRMSAMGYATASGVVRHRDPAAVEESGGEESGDDLTRFWFRAPDSWRVEDEGGVRHVQNDEWTYVRDGAGRMQRQPTSSIFWSFGGGHPAVLLGNAQQRHERFSDTDDFCVPIGAASAVEVAGRLAWEFALRPPPRKPHPLRVAIDDETGAVLRMAIPELGYAVEMVQFHADLDLSEDVFQWDGPAVTDWTAERERDEAFQEWFAEQSVPVPRWWPTGVSHWPGSGDPATGAYYVDLDVAGGAMLGRWALGGEPPPRWVSRAAKYHVHSWQDRTWQWALAVPSALTDDELRQVVASIPAQEPGR